MDRYIDERQKIRSPSTIRGYTDIVNRLTADYPQICNKKLTAVRDSDIQTIINTLGLSPKTLRNYVGFIQAASGKKYNVALPQRVKPQVRIPSDMEVAGLIRVAEDMYPDLAVPVMLGCFGPLRRSEICALTLDDFEGDWVNISKGKVKDAYGHFQVKDIPKTTESARRIKLPHFVVRKIREQGYVTKYNPDQISHYFRRMQQRIGLEDVYNFHSTRHYCVSSLHANGLPDAYIMERGGWSTPDVLIYVYRHTISDETAALTDRALNHFDSVTKFVTI
jgi:integrase